MPNVKPVADAAGDLGALAELLNRMAPEARRAAGILLFNEDKTRAQNLRFMQKVFVRYRGSVNRDYVSNFLEAYVMYATKDVYKLMSKDGRCVLTYTSVCRPVIFTEAEFAPMLDKMVRKGKQVDPDVEQMIVRRFRCEEEYELNLVDKADPSSVSTIDSVFEGNGIRKGRKKGLPDLISLVDDAAAGFNVDKESKTYSRDVRRNKDSEPSRGDVFMTVSGGKD